VFEAAIFVGQSEDGAEVRCEISRRVETAVSRYSGPSALRFLRCPARIHSTEPRVPRWGRCAIFGGAGDEAPP
jgi:hypothetical protein